MLANKLKIQKLRQKDIVNHSKNPISFLAYLTGISNLKLDKSIVDVIASLQKLDNEDQEHIFTTTNVLVSDAKTRTTYA